MWVLPNPGFVGGLSWPKFILLLKGQVLWGCATTGADKRNAWGMCDWQGGGWWQHGCLQPPVKLHPKACWSKVEKVMHLEKGATLSDAAEIKPQHAANPGPSSRQSLPCVTPCHSSGSIKLGLPLPFNPYLYTGRFLLGSR